MLVNNRAEGNALLTVEGLVGMLREDTQRPDPLSEPSHLFQIPPWSHCMPMEASMPAEGFHSGF